MSEIGGGDLLTSQTVRQQAGPHPGCIALTDGIRSRDGVQDRRRQAVRSEPGAMLTSRLSSSSVNS